MQAVPTFLVYSVYLCHTNEMTKFGLKQIITFRFLSSADHGNIEIGEKHVQSKKVRKFYFIMRHAGP
jgi:hypothetical protein